MTQGDGLRRLQMGEARHHRFGMGEGLFRQRRLQVTKPDIERVHRVANPQTEIERDLIVAGASGMEASGRFPDDLGQPRFHIHMDVFEGAPEGKGAGLDFARDLR